MSGNMITANYDLEGKQSFDPSQNPAARNIVTSETDPVTGGVKTIAVLTQAQYDALSVKDPNTEYNIVEA